MHNNYFFLKQIAYQLNLILIGKQLIESFSQNKDELILIFTNKLGEKTIIKALLSPIFSCISFPTDYKRANNNSVNIFEKIVGLNVHSILQHANERAFSILFERNFQLVFKLFGNKSNLILFENELVTQIFQTKLKADYNLKIEYFEREINLNFDQYIVDEFELTKTIPTLGKSQIDYLKKEYLKKNTSQSFDNQHFWNFVMKQISEIENPNYYIFEKNGMPILSLFPMETCSEIYHEPIDAINYFYQKYARVGGIIKEKYNLQSEFDNKITKYNKTLKTIEKRLKSFDSGASNEEIANILMANIHSISVYNNHIELLDFYRNVNIKIAVKSELTLQKNAEIYYRKAKNEKIEIDILKEKRKNILDEIEILGKTKLELLKLDDLKSIRNYSKYYQSTKSNSSKITELPFKEIIIDSWQIWIGKNAQNNDLLTLKFAKKDDLWLHARDVVGSHVVVRQQSGKIFPKHIIEKAAELAAFYSKRKTDSVCSVIVTPKKFVRKPKNTPAGKVIVDKEETILVVPKGP